jgi:peroxiredoxin
MTRPSAGFASLVLVAGLAAAADTPTLPRYRLEPGQEITYRSRSTFKYGDKKSTGEHGSRIDWTVWVVRPNKDGSFRLVIRQQDAFYQVYSGKKYEQPAQTRLVYADVFPDGRILPNDTIGYQGHPEAIFPRLPRDATEAARGWSWQRDGDRFTARPVKTDKGFRFETVARSPLNVIYLSSGKSTSTFDPAQGLIATAQSASTQGYGFNGKGTGSTELIAVRRTDPTLGKLLAAEDRKYFESLAAYDKSLQRAVEVGPEDAKKRLEAAGAALRSVKLTHPVLKAALAERLKGHDQAVKYRIEEIARRAKVVGKPAAAFETKDMDGKPVKLADLKGKVVVLDFWYRGCGWCIKAMPQMNALAEDFKGKPVAIFGMNTDPREEDARFVIEKMALKYPTLKAIGLPEKFGVQGFPTLIVIDQQGKVHDLHVGYTPTLRQDVGRQIKALLQKK